MLSMPTHVCILTVCMDSVHAAFVCGKRERGKRNSPFELISFHRCPDMKGGNTDIC